MKWHNEQRKVDELISFDGNPRKMSKEQAEQLLRSIEKYDLVEIPAINTNNIILAGHQRINALKLLGRNNEVIDVRVPDRELTDAEAKEYLLRSNKNTGDWDLDLLPAFGHDLLEEVGFTESEIADMMPQDIDSAGQATEPKPRECSHCPIHCPHDWEEENE